MNKLKTYVINLKERTDRKKEMKKILKNLNFKSYKFIEATNRKNKSIQKGLKSIKRSNKISDNVSKKYIKNISSKKTKLNKKIRGTIANFISHMRIWYSIGSKKGTSNNYTLILEDDAVPTPYFKDSSKLLTVIKNNKIPFVYLGDCFRTNYSHKFLRYSKKLTTKNNKLVPKYTECLHAYLVSNSFCKQFVRDIDQFFPISMPSDNFLNKYFYENKIPFYVANKSLFNQNLDFGSDIQFTGDDKLN